MNSALYRVLSEGATAADISAELKDAEPGTARAIRAFTDAREGWRVAAAGVERIDRGLKAASHTLHAEARRLDGPARYGRARQIVMELEEELTAPDDVARALAQWGSDAGAVAVHYGELLRRSRATRLLLSRRRIALEQASRPLVGKLAASAFRGSQPAP